MIPDSEISPTASRASAEDEPGFGSLRTGKGALPLEAMDVRGRIDGLLARVVVRQTFVNAFDEPLEASYIFPMPDRAAVTQFRMTVAGREIEGVLEERGQAREHYEEAIAKGQRASIAEEDRPGVFNLRVGNLMPGERATVELSLCGVLPYTDGEVTFRFPLVVAPRYVPGRPLPGPSVGDGTALDTDAVPDASRISPPVLLPGFPNPVRLSLELELDGGVAGLGGLRSSLHAIEEETQDGYCRIRIRPGERLDRDFILRFRLGGDDIRSTLSLHPDRDDQNQGTFALTVIPPARHSERSTRPRDIVFLLDRSGSMNGWKMVAARRAVARMIDTLGDDDSFCLMAFDSTVEGPKTLCDGLTPATDRARFRAVEYLATLEARGGTEMAEPLDRAVKRLSASKGGDRDRILVLITDGQIANEDQVLGLLGTRLNSIRVFTIGIDRAVNEGFLRRLAERGGRARELVESEDRLDAVMASIHRRIGTLLLTGLNLEPVGLNVEPGEVVPRRIPDLFAGSPLLILGRYRGRPEGSIGVCGCGAAGSAYQESVHARVRPNPAIAAAWARGQIRHLEDRYAARDGDRTTLEKAVVALSLQFQVLCRFTAYVAVDRSQVVNKGGVGHRITQPVEAPAGWEAMSTTYGTVACVGAPGAALPRGGRGGYGHPSRGVARSRGNPPDSAPPPARAMGFFEAGRGALSDGEVVDSFLMEAESPAAPAPTLKDYLGGGRAWAPRDAASLVAQLAEAVQMLHDQGFVHGELSPSKIPMGDGKHPSLSPIPDDWRRPAGRAESEPHVVTPYTAPERFGNAAVALGPVVDIYSLGVILYVLLTGLRPLPRAGQPDPVRWILQATPPRPRQVRRSIPAALEEICLKAMAKDPGSRYATAGELAAALREFLKPQRKAFWR
jgi:Ca-activated chloride channel family protein